MTYAGRHRPRCRTLRGLRPGGAGAGPREGGTASRCAGTGSRDSRESEYRSRACGPRGPRGVVVPRSDSTIRCFALRAPAPAGCSASAGLGRVTPSEAAPRSRGRSGEPVAPGVSRLPRCGGDGAQAASDRELARVAVLPRHRIRPSGASVARPERASDTRASRRPQPGTGGSSLAGLARLRAWGRNKSDRKPVPRSRSP
jgi:hypothetical protein